MSPKISSFLDQVQIVLVETQDGANIGSVCRAMKTMGISRLAVTGNREYDEKRIKTLAIHAYDIYEKSILFPDLESALKGSVLSVGSTRRKGKFRKYFSLTPDQLGLKAASFGEGTISIVFGREADGLTDAELNLCDMAVCIPSSPDFPSLNLAQAVQVITYSLYKHAGERITYAPIDRSRLDEVTHTITEAFDDIHFFKLDEKDEVRRFFRDILARSGLSEKEAARMEKMFRKMSSVSRFKIGQ